MAGQLVVNRSSSRRAFAPRDEPRDGLKASARFGGASNDRSARSALVVSHERCIIEGHAVKPYRYFPLGCILETSVSRLSFVREHCGYTHSEEALRQSDRHTVVDGALKYRRGEDTFLSSMSISIPVGSLSSLDFGFLVL